MAAVSGSSDTPAGQGAIFRRYSDIANLHDQLIRNHPLHAHLLADAGLPPKSLFKNSTSVVAARQRDLARYLTFLINTPPFASSPLVLTLLGVPEGASLGSFLDNPANRLGLGPAAAPWLDRFHRVQAAIVDVRKAALERDAKLAQGDTLRASQIGTQAVHDAGTILSEINALDLALTSSSSSGAASASAANASAAVSAKERVRRGNLLLSAKQEIVAVQQRLNVSSYFSDSTTGTAAPGSGSRSPAFASLVGSTAASPARAHTPTVSSSPSHHPPGSGGGRRVVGRANSLGTAAAAGTVTPPSTVSLGTGGGVAELASMDNAGLLQLQRAQMADQDAAVEQIGAVVGRLKNLGHVMNDELEVQNQMLDETREDVDRVAGRMRAAEKKIKRLN